jgi:hypothetical protein
LNGSVDQFKRGLTLSNLTREHPQQMQRVYMVGRELQYLSIKSLRLGQLTGVVVGYPLLEQEIHSGSTGTYRLFGGCLLTLGPKTILASGLHAYTSSINSHSSKIPMGNSILQLRR